MQQRVHSQLSANGNGASRPISYEAYLVETAIELLREIANHFERVANMSDVAEEKKLMAQNSRRAFSAVDHMRRMELPS